MAGAPPAMSSWNAAFNRCRAKLGPEESAQILQVRDYSQSQLSLEILQAKYKRKTIPNILSRIEPFLSNLRSFHGIIDTAVQAKPDVAALIWGGIKLVLEVTSF